jgi:hypothetical protein
MIYKPTESDRKVEILFKLGLDPNYITKAKQSICQDCVWNLGFKEDFYECKQANDGVPFEVEYKREGVFHTEIVKCEKFRI